MRVLDTIAYSKYRIYSFRFTLQNIRLGYFHSVETGIGGQGKSRQCAFSGNVYYVPILQRFRLLVYFLTVGMSSIFTIKLFQYLLIMLAVTGMDLYVGYSTFEITKNIEKANNRILNETFENVKYHKTRHIGYTYDVIAIQLSVSHNRLE